MDDTIVAIATASGEGAIGVVRLSGSDARAIAQRLFKPRSPRKKHAWQSHRARLGTVIDPDTERVVDQVLLTYMRGPQTYTGQDVIEISGHGGIATREIERIAIGLGARSAERGEFTLRAFLAGKIDLAQAEGISDAVSARTPTALSIAMQQISGGLSGAIASIRNRVLGVYAAIEASIDFAEDDVPSPDEAWMERELASAACDLAALLATAQAGRLFRQGVRVVLAGRPNAGKSSLLNALLLTDRAIVTSLPGTTRDVIEESLDLDGVPVVLADTAGIGETKHPIERIGIERTHAALAHADVVCVVLDGSVPLGAEDRAFASALAGVRATRVLAVNKADLPVTVDLSTAAALMPGATPVAVSALTGDGLGTLRAALREASGSGMSADSAHAQTVVTNARHLNALTRAADHLEEARLAVRSGTLPDLICTDLRQALSALGEVTGDTVTKDLLSTIFSRFCIGK